MPTEAEIVSLDRARIARDAAKAKKARPIGNCARGVREECGMTDSSQCEVHAPYLKPPEAS